QLRRATVLDVNLAGGGAISVELLMPPEFGVAGSPVVSAGTLLVTWDAVVGNKVLASPADGSSGSPAFRHLTARDGNLPSVAIPAEEIDWSVANTFYKSLGADPVFTFNNNSDGRVIHV